MTAMEQPTSSASEGPHSTAQPLEVLPWEARHQRGWLQAFVETTTLLVARPQEAFLRMRRSGDLASPLLFALVTVTMGSVLQLAWSWVFPQWGLLGFQEPPGFGISRVLAGGFALVLTIVVVPVFAVLGVLVGAGLLHLSWLLVSGFRSAVGFEATLRVVSYASVPQMLGAAVPIVGSLLAVVWSIALQVVGMTKLHGASLGRAIVAVLLPMIVCCFALAALLTMVIGVVAAGVFRAGLLDF